jgi:hypothetical protein
LQDNADDLHNEHAQEGKGCLTVKDSEDLLSNPEADFGFFPTQALNPLSLFMFLLAGSLFHIFSLKMFFSKKRRTKNWDEKGK